MRVLGSAEGAVQPAIGKVGADYLRLATSMPRWIRRRSHRVELIDGTVGAQTVRVDIDLSVQGELLPTWNGGLLLPLAVFDRSKPHADIVLVDEAGSRVGRLNRVEERGLALGGFRRLLAGELETGLDEHISRELENVIVRGCPMDRIREWSRAAVPDRGAPEYARVAQAGFLVRSQELAPLVEELRQHYYLAAIVSDQASLRRVFSWSFLAPIQEDTETGGPTGLVERFTSVVYDTWKRPGTHPIGVQVTSAGDCASFHVHVTAPDEVNLDTATLSAVIDGGGRTDDEELTVVDHDRLGVEAHVFAEIGRPTKKAVLRTRMYLQPGGLPQSALMASGFTTFVLLLALTYLLGPGNLEIGPDSREAAAALLLLVPGVVSGLAGKPTRIRRTTQLIQASRTALGAGMVVSFLAASMVVVGANSLVLGSGFGILAIAAAACTVLMVNQWSRLQALVRTSPPVRPAAPCPGPEPAAGEV